MALTLAQVDLTIPQAILLSMWRRRAAGNVNVAYLIEALEQISPKSKSQEVLVVFGDCHHHSNIAIIIPIISNPKLEIPDDTRYTTARKPMLAAGLGEFRKC